MSLFTLKNISIYGLFLFVIFLYSCKEEKLVFKGTVPPIFPNSVLIEGKGFVTSMPIGENRSAEYYETDKSMEEVKKFYMDFLEMNGFEKNSDFPLCEYFVEISSEKNTIIKIESSKCF